MILISYDDIVQDISPIGYDGDIFDTINWANEIFPDEDETHSIEHITWNIRSQFE